MSFCQLLSPWSEVSNCTERWRLVFTVYNQPATHTHNGIEDIFQSRYSIAWLTLPMRIWKEKEGKRRKMLWMWLSGRSWHPRSQAHLRDNKPQRARPPLNGTWPELHPGSPAIEVRARKAHLALILLVFNFALVCREGNKQSSSPTLFPYSCLPPPGPYFPPGPKIHFNTHRLGAH